MSKCCHCGKEVDKERNPDFEYNAETRQYICGPCVETAGDDQRQNRYDQMQWEMFHDPNENWSGNR